MTIVRNLLFVISTTSQPLFVASFAQKKYMYKTNLLSSMTGALGLYAGVKGMFDSANAANKQRRMLSDAKAEEDAWFRRNYYGNYLDSSMARAALRRVEKTLHRANNQNRARAVVAGETPELTLARNEQGLRSMENVIGNITENDTVRKERVESAHRANVNAIRNKEMAILQDDEQVANNDILGGAQLIRNAVAGMNWGKQKGDKKEAEEVDYGKVPRWDW